MAEYRPSSGGVGGGQRRLDIVSGRGYNASHAYVPTWPRQDLPPTSPPHGIPSRQAASSSWGFADPELQRKKRIAKYKVYSIEGRFKASIRNGYRWIKNKCSEIIHGY